MELHERLKLVIDESTFLEFVSALANERRAAEAGIIDDFGRSRNGWENHSIEEFLDAGVAWADASNFGAKQGLANAPPWKIFATFLYCGKIYE